VAAGGTLANLIFGALFFVAERAVRQTASWRYFFWLLMTFNLFDASGYFLFSGVGISVIGLRLWGNGIRRGRGASA
jgi:hypothetical protein